MFDKLFNIIDSICPRAQTRTSPPCRDASSTSGPGDLCLKNTRIRGTGSAKDPMWRGRVCLSAIRFAYSPRLRVAVGTVRVMDLCFPNRKDDALRHRLPVPCRRQATRKVLGRKLSQTTFTVRQSDAEHVATAMSVNRRVGAAAFASNDGM